VKRGFNENSWVVARKPHRCIWCYEQIEIGESHTRYVGSWEGEFQDWRMHEECWTDYDLNYDSEEGFMPGEAQRPQKADAPQ
jgi:hypothetical protein